MARLRSKKVSENFAAVEGKKRQARSQITSLRGIAPTIGEREREKEREREGGTER